MVRLSAVSSGRFYTPPTQEICLVLITVKRLSRPQDHSAAGRIRPTKNSKGAIGNRTRDLPACSAVPQPNGPSCAPDTLCGTYYYVTTTFFRSGGSVPGIMATGWTIWGSNLGKGKIFFFYQNVQTTYRVNLISYSVANEFFLRGYSSRDVRLTTHLHLVPILRTNGRTSPFPLRDFMACKQTTLPLPLPAPFHTISRSIFTKRK